jgi:hypothetical protein
MKFKFHLILKSAAAIPSDLFNAAKKVQPAMSAACGRSEKFARDLIVRSEAPFRSHAPQPQIGFRY